MAPLRNLPGLRAVFDHRGVERWCNRETSGIETEAVELPDQINPPAVRRKRGRERLEHPAIPAENPDLAGSHAPDVQVKNATLPMPTSASTN